MTTRRDPRSSFQPWTSRVSGSPRTLRQRSLRAPTPLEAERVLRIAPRPDTSFSAAGTASVRAARAGEHARRRAGRDLEHLDRPAVVASEAGVDPPPVSYTHLTLPT